MRKEDNPFAPGAGTEPPELVGREVILDDGSVALARSILGRPARSQIFYGLCSITEWCWPSAPVIRENASRYTPEGNQSAPN